MLKILFEENLICSLLKLIIKMFSELLFTIHIEILLIWQQLFSSSNLYYSDWSDLDFFKNNVHWQNWVIQLTQLNQCFKKLTKVKIPKNLVLLAKWHVFLTISTNIYPLQAHFAIFFAIPNSSFRAESGHCVFKQ